MILGGQNVTAICPGGLMACSSAEVMRAAGGDGRATHADAQRMAGVARGIADETGFDNVGVPFCTTVEAEALGARVDFEHDNGRPTIVGHTFESLRELATLPQRDLTLAGRIPAVLGAIEILARQDRVVVGSLTGPLSMLVSLVQPASVRVAMSAEPRAVAAALDRMVETLLQFGSAMIDAGADVLMIGEYGCRTLEMDGSCFARFAEEPLAALSSSFMPRADVVLHVCGEVYPIVRSLRRIPMSGFSFDSMVQTEKLRAAWPDAVLVGNMGTQALRERSPEAITEMSAALRWRGVDIVAPACGIAPDTPADNLRAMVLGARQAAEELSRANGAERSTRDRW